MSPILKRTDDLIGLVFWMPAGCWRRKLPETTIEKAASALGISSRRLRQLCKAGRVKHARRVGGSWLLRVNKQGIPNIRVGTRGPRATYTYVDPAESTDLT